ncbi:ABC transporter permease [Neptunitalea lumnitzerae]|nr:ABC transporter permease [Neptunitalea sp. Y10]
MFLNLIGLSIGISGLIFAILYWNDEHAYDAWNTEKSKVFEVINDMGENGEWYTNPAPLGPHLLEESDLVASYCYLNNWYNGANIYYNGEKEYSEKILDAQSNFFEYFPFDFLQGDKASALEPNSIVLSQKLANRIFGDEDPMNKEITYSNRKMVVKGVYKLNEKSSYKPEAVINAIDERLKHNEDAWGNYNFGLLIKLKNPDSKEKVAKQMETIYYKNKLEPSARDLGITPQEYEAKYGGFLIKLQALKDIRLGTINSGVAEGQGNRQFLLIMMGVSILILILSIVNYINLATANAIKRAKEVGVRKIIGATKVDIIKQFLFETALMSAVAIVISLVIVELVLPVYNDFLNKDLVIQGGLIYTQLVCIFIVLIIMAGVFPALYVANFETLKVLRGNFGRSKGGIWLRNGMLVLQFAIAAFFIVGSYIVYQQVQFMSTKDLGFKGDQIIEIYLRQKNPEAVFQRYETVRNEVAKIEGVKEVSTGIFDLGGGARSSSSFEYKGNNIQGQNMAMDFGMLEMLKIPVIEGRNISTEFASDTISSMLVNEAALRVMDEKNPIGKSVTWNGEDLKIIGVVKDFNLFGLDQDIPPMVFFHVKTIDWMQYNLDKVFVKIDASKMEETIARIETFWNSKIDDEYAFNYDFVNKKYERTYMQYVNQKNLFSVLNIVVIIIALFGLFALASFSIERRMKEIAIRKTLGADTKHLLITLTKQYVVFCVIGFLIAIVPVYYLLSGWLENFVFRISISVLPFVIGFVALLVLTLIVVLGRAYRAVSLDILTYLKYE